MAFEFSFSGKYLDLLKEIAPHVTRVAVFRDDTNPTGLAQFGVIRPWQPQVGCK
jgi:putative ABC transport system substrate-binding protein